MICPDCARAADLDTTVPAPALAAAITRATPEAVARLEANHARVVAGLHSRCKGPAFCPCQHRPRRKT